MAVPRPVILSEVGMTKLLNEAIFENPGVVVTRTHLAGVTPRIRRNFSLDCRWRATTPSKTPLTRCPPDLLCRTRGVLPIFDAFAEPPTAPHK